MKIKLAFCFLFLAVTTSGCFVYDAFIDAIFGSGSELAGPWEQTQDSQTATAQRKTQDAKELTEQAQWETELAATESARQTARAATATALYLEVDYERVYHEDFTDSRDCKTGKSSSEPVDPAINITEIKVRKDPETDAYTFELIFGQLVQFETEFGGDLGFYDPVLGALEGGRLFYQNIEHNVYTFWYNPEEGLRSSQWTFNSRRNEWQEIPLADDAVLMEENIIYFVIPSTSDTSGTNVDPFLNQLFFAAITNADHTECNTMLLNDNNMPYESVPEFPLNQ